MYIFVYIFMFQNQSFFSFQWDSQMSCNSPKDQELLL